LIETLAAGRYRIERELGHGGMATVYLARDEELHRPVAIKVLAAHLLEDEAFRRRFLREAQLAARLSHPNVVQVYDAGADEDRPYIVMEFVPGGTVADRGQVTTDAAVALGLQACAGLQHAHNAGLVHRDIKPANLLVREDEVLKIADFGIARAAEATHLTQQGTLLGTAAYLSPEQAAGQDATTASDVYSLGAVLYELLTARSPYEFESLAELAVLQRSGEITPVRDLVPSVPEPVEAAVMHALAREPRFRPPSAAAFAEELALAPEVRTEPLLATAITEPLQSRTYQSIPGGGTWLWVAVAGAVAAAAIVLGLIKLGDGGNSTSERPSVSISAPDRGASAEVQARNLSAWLRAHAGR
jgi:eukaryotic-like serine/threonine-protein kinase